MKNPIIDKRRPSLACLGTHYILLVALKLKISETTLKPKQDPETLQITYDDIMRAMDSRFGPDQVMRKQIEILVSYGYLKQEKIDEKIFITLL